MKEQLLDKNNSPIDYKRLFQSSPDLYLILNPKLEIIEASQAYLVATMVERDNVIGENIFTVFPDNPNDTDANGVRNLRASLEGVLKYKKQDKMPIQKYDIRKPDSLTEEFEERYWSPINTPVFSSTNEIIYIIHRVEDVTAMIRLKQILLDQRKSMDRLRTHAGRIEKEMLERTQEVQKVQETNRQLHIVNQELTKNEIDQFNFANNLELIDDVVITKTLDGIIKSWNGGAERLYGYKSEEIVGKPISIIFPENIMTEHDYILGQIKKGNSVRLLETERKHKNGHKIPISLTISPILNKENKVIGGCIIGHDITEWKKIDKIKNEFISIVSHELRTPLTSILGSLELLVAGVAGKALPEQDQKLLIIAKQNSERLVRLINDILDIEKIESGKMEYNQKIISIAELAQEAVILNRAYGEKYGVGLQLLKTEDAWVNVDAGRILQVFSNLISNAVKYSSAGNNVKIAITRQSDNTVRIAVTNIGGGIPKELQGKIFQKFSQIDSSRSHKVGGTGLGLAISKEIIEKLNGSIDFISAEDETTFYFELPIASLPTNVYYKKTVLICEDDVDMVRFLKNVLEADHYNVVTSNSAEEAKRVIFMQHVDVLLLDLILPGQDGISLIKELRNEHKIFLPIIIVSIKAIKTQKMLNGNALMVLDWIQKPIDKVRLLKTIELINDQCLVGPSNILHVEDDIDLLEIFANLISSEANITGVTSLKQAEEELIKKKYDLVVLDLLLPDGSGTKLLPIISKQKIPVIVFSAYELPKAYAQKVTESLIKCKITQGDLIKIIRSSLKDNRHGAELYEGTGKNFSDGR